MEKKIFDAVPDWIPCGICVVSLEEEYPILYANTYFYKLFGYEKEVIAAIKGEKASRFLPTNELAILKEKIHAKIGGQNANFELQHQGICMDGSLKWFQFSCTWTPLQPNLLLIAITDISELKKTEQELDLQKEIYRIAFENTDYTINIFDIESHSLYQSQKWDQNFNLPPVNHNIPESLAGENFIAPGSKSTYIKFFYDMIQGIPCGESLLQLLHIDGTYRWYNVKYTLIYNQEKPWRSIITYIDVTQQQEKEIAFHKWNTYFSTQRKNSLAYCEYNLTQDIFRCLEDNGQSFPTETMTLSEFVEYSLAHNIDEQDKELFQKTFSRERFLMQHYENRNELELEYRWRYRSDVIWVSNFIQLITDPISNDIKAFILIKNVDYEKREQEKVRKRLECDEVTGLLNRTTYINQVSSYLAGTTDVNHALIMIDVDNFKQFNDNFGHQFGDKVLADVAASMRKCLRIDDLFGRIGGDEFSIFMKNLPSTEAVTRRLKQLLQAASKTYDIGACVTVSMGLAFYPQNGKSFHQLYHQADKALYRAKNDGRNQFSIY